MDFSPTLGRDRVQNSKRAGSPARRAWTHATGLPLLRSAPAGPRGLRTQNASSATLHPANAARVLQDGSWPGRPRGQHGSLFSCLGPACLRRRPHAFHTGARRWNRGHSLDSAKSRARAQERRGGSWCANRDYLEIAPKRCESVGQGTRRLAMAIDF